jgi:hypothetical protein
LTFGELAFIGATGGATANRLYIAGAQGVCVWIGAQILNQPTFWSGLTAQTTIPTVSAVRDALIAGFGSGGEMTFGSDLSVRIAANKFFGKYTRGDTIPAQGQTVKWVIENALTETISPTVPAISFNAPNNTVSAGQTSGTINLNVSYTIQTIGAVAAGSTLEFRYGAGSWIFLTGSLNNASTSYSNSYSASFNRLTDSGADGRWGSAALTYRYTVHDSAGASASNTGTITPSTVANPSVSAWSVNANSLRTGLLGATNGTETHTYREKGNTFCTIGYTITRGNTFIPLTSYVTQARQFFNGAWGAWTNIGSANAISGNPLNLAPSGITFTPSVTGASLDQLQFRVAINDDYYDGAGSGPGTTYDAGTGADVYFNYMVFYGTTASVPSVSSDFRGLCSGLISGNSTTNPGSGVNIGANSLSQTWAGLPGTPGGKVFIIAVPDGVTIQSVLDSGDSFNDQFPVAFNFGGAPNTTFTTIPDRNGNAKNYNVYIMSNAVDYNNSSRYHIITRTNAAVTTP